MTLTRYASLHGGDLHANLDESSLSELLKHMELPTALVYAAFVQPAVPFSRARLLIWKTS